MTEKPIPPELGVDIEHLFYLLLRDRSAASDIELIVRQVEQRRKSGLVPEYSNEFVALYAAELADRMLGEPR